MKILLFYSSHRQLKEYEYSSIFFNRSNFLKENCDVMCYCDNDLITEDELKSYISYDTNVKIIKGKQIFPSGISTGISGNGIHIGLNNCFNEFLDYDYVINMVPDCYITTDIHIKKLLEDELYTDNNFIVDHHPDHDASTKYQFCCDFFVFKPKKIYNFFKEVDMNSLILPENFIFNKIKEYNIKYKIIKRIGSLQWIVDNYGLIHNHDLQIIKNILNE